MNLIDLMLAARQRVTPEEGCNLVGIDSFEPVGEELYVIAAFPTREEAEEAMRALQEVPGVDDMVIYEASTEPVRKVVDDRGEKHDDLGRFSTVSGHAKERPATSMPPKPVKQPSAAQPAGPSASEPDYRGEHEAPDKSSGAPMHDVNGVYPDDFYGPNGFRYYADFGRPCYRESYDKIVRSRHHPGAKLTVYRAIPKDVKGTAINPGDWVTLSRGYAKEHGESLAPGKYRVASKMVSARDLFTDGNDVNEWGYDPQPYDSAEEQRYRALRAARRGPRPSEAAAYAESQTHGHEHDPEGVGFTVHYVTGEVPHEGYAIAYSGTGNQDKRTKNLTPPPSGFTAAAFDQYGQANLDLLSQPRYYLGGWEQAGELVLDVSEVVPDKATALRLAHERDEQAIYGFKEGDSFYTMSDQQRPSESKGQKITKATGPRFRFIFGKDQTPQQMADAVNAAWRKHVGPFEDDKAE